MAENVWPTKAEIQNVNLKERPKTPLEAAKGILPESVIAQINAAIASGNPATIKQADKLLQEPLKSTEGVGQEVLRGLSESLKAASFGATLEAAKPKEVVAALREPPKSTKAPEPPVPVPTKVEPEFKALLAIPESQGQANPYEAENPNSSAVGKYQFLWNTWGDKISQFAQQKFPARYAGEVTKEQFKGDKDLQETFMDEYDKTVLSPEAAQLQKDFADKGLTLNQAKALVHYQGGPAARKYLETGVDPTESQLDENGNRSNMPIAVYLKKMGVEPVKGDSVAPHSPELIAGKPLVPSQKAREQEHKDALAEAANRIADLYGKQGDSEEFRAFRTAIENERRDVQSAINLYQQERDDTRKRELFAALARAVGQLALGVYGARNIEKGINVGDFEFKPMDWSQEYARVKDDLNMAISRSKADRTAAEEVYRLSKEQLAAEMDKSKFVYQLLLEKAREDRALKRELRIQKNQEATQNRLAQEAERSELHRQLKAMNEQYEGQLKTWSAGQRAILGLGALEGDADDIQEYVNDNKKDLALAFGEARMDEMLKEAEKARDWSVFNPFTWFGKDQRVLDSLAEQMRKEAGGRPLSPAEALTGQRSVPAAKGQDQLLQEYEVVKTDPDRAKAWIRANFKDSSEWTAFATDNRL